MGPLMGWTCWRLDLPSHLRLTGEGLRPRSMVGGRSQPLTAWARGRAQVWSCGHLLRVASSMGACFPRVRKKEKNQGKGTGLDRGRTL